ncbi:MAG TPA: hydroxymethylglutaryl-CoA reductase, degradative [Anaerolineae bacterium]|nr:hydroxymethylglutaryl-CoA reductase, degradative [Anaerolineae bacterium]
MPNNRSSRLPGFYALTLKERLDALAQVCELDSESLTTLSGEGGLTSEEADHMIENVIGTYGLPLGIAVNFLVNGREVLVPMAIEETSVVAGASYMAKLVRSGGGFTAKSTESKMIAQIQILELKDLETAKLQLLEHKEQLLDAADEVNQVITQMGGGARDLEVRMLPDTPAGPMLVVHLIYDTRDAMGANTINTAAEALAPRIEILTGGRAHLRILSNLADQRLANARCRIPCGELAFGEFSGERVRDGIIEAWALAVVDPYRAATHNKGIMNGIDAVLVATGNDWRAVEAGAHAYAARSGQYTSLSNWWVNQEGDLEGELEMPLAVGIIGGATRVHPTAKTSLKLLGVGSAREFAEIVVSVGLAQNLAALRALATEGIQRGHMALHARQIAIAAGAEGSLVEKVAKQLVDEGTVSLDRAQELVQTVGKEGRSR